MDALMGLTGACIAAPHVFYAFVWFAPEIWIRLFGERSVERFASVAKAGKVLQFSVLYYWIYSSSGSLGIPRIKHVPTVMWIPGLALAFCGQGLNIAIYNAIGEAGVYYGFKLGQPVPWCTGFPFNIVSHPQYVGSVLTLWGLGSITWSQAPPGFTYLLCFWTFLYVLTGLQEQYL